MACHCGDMPSWLLTAPLFMLAGAQLLLLVLRRSPAARRVVLGPAFELRATLGYRGRHRPDPIPAGTPGGRFW